MRRVWDYRIALEPAAVLNRLRESLDSETLLGDDPPSTAVTGFVEGDRFEARLVGTAGGAMESHGVDPTLLGRVEAVPEGSRVEARVRLMPLYGAITGFFYLAGIACIAVWLPGSRPGAGTDFGVVGPSILAMTLLVDLGIRMGCREREARLGFFVQNLFKSDLVSVTRKLRWR